MKISKQIAKHLREVFFGVNWTWSNLKNNLKDVTWQEATTQVYSLNTIATLTFHMCYFIGGTLKVLKGGPLDIKDKYSFDHPPINCQADWDEMLDKIWLEVEEYASTVEKLSDDKLEEVFVEEKYGNYYRNLHGIIEHCHYHLGQIVVIKKILAAQKK